MLRMELLYGMNGFDLNAEIDMKWITMIMIIVRNVDNT